ncbi:MAG: hypothetical protein Ta2D_02340 [Rickettsiales bacterium]|nr:MAG: hypothetical protein Ta2D_02340 [Rickettsiales bacterium]
MAFENLEFFKANFDDLYKKYKDKYIAIKDQKVIGVFDNRDFGYDETVKTEKNGTFIVQWCNPKQLEPIYVGVNVVGKKIK